MAPPVRHELAIAVQLDVVIWRGRSAQQKSLPMRPLIVLEAGQDVAGIAAGAWPRQGEDLSLELGWLLGLAGVAWLVPAQLR
eukprot:6821966-Pyramimonas_sp.AAC.1